MSVYDGSATVINGVPVIIVAGLTPNSTSKFCHARATPADLTDPNLVDWIWDTEPLYCGNTTAGLKPFDAPTSAWQTSLGQWQYQDGLGGVYVSDDGAQWRHAVGGNFLHGMVCDFFPLPRVCDDCAVDSHGASAASPMQQKPTHVHEAANVYSFVMLTEAGRDEAGNVTIVEDGGASIIPASSLGVAPYCAHGSFGFPKSFYDPVKKRRLQYGWVQGSGFQGEEDATFYGLSLKNNVQSLIREVTYDPRFGMLNFFPVAELALLRKPPVAQISTPTAVPPNGIMPLTSGLNQSEIRVTFAVPTQHVVFGVRIMGKLTCWVVSDLMKE